MKNLRKLRTERNLSQQKLAKIVGLSQQSINKYENGQTQPDFQMLMQFAEFFHTSIDYLIGYTDNPNSYRTISDIHKEEDDSLSPYIVDKLKKNKSVPLLPTVTTVQETKAFDAISIYETTPKERYHLSMYRKLSPTMQNSLDSFLEDFAPDDDYKEYQRSKNQES